MCSIMSRCQSQWLKLASWQVSIWTRSSVSKLEIRRGTQASKSRPTVLTTTRSQLTVQRAVSLPHTEIYHSCLRLLSGQHASVLDSVHLVWFCCLAHLFVCYLLLWVLNHCNEYVCYFCFVVFCLRLQHATSNAVRQNHHVNGEWPTHEHLTASSVIRWRPVPLNTCIAYVLCSVTTVSDLVPKDHFLSSSLRPLYNAQLLATRRRQSKYEVQTRRYSGNISRQRISM